MQLGLGLGLVFGFGGPLGGGVGCFFGSGDKATSSATDRVSIAGSGMSGSYSISLLTV